MSKKIILYFLLFTPFFYSINSKTIFDFSKTKKDEFIANLSWELNTDKINSTGVEWELDLESDAKLIRDFSSKKKKNVLNIRSLGKGVEVNGNPYPEISNYVNNAFVESPNKFINFSLRAISKTRSCIGSNFSFDCSDGVFETDFNLINSEKFSFNPKITVQSLTNRNGGTEFGEASSLGFKLAHSLSNKWHISFGGENVVHLDKKTDLGRNFYMVGSTFYPLNKFENPSIIFLTFGIGSDFYGYSGNGYIARTSCLGKPNLTGEGSYDCNWGPIGSISLAFNDRIALNSEWFGYGYGTGFSVRPFKNKLINMSIYATDYIRGFPSYVEEGCYSNCETRFYGSLSFGF